MPRREDAALPLAVTGAEKPPSAAKRDGHAWADWIELRCLIDADGLVTPGQVASWLREDPQDAGDPEPEGSESEVTTQVQDADFVPDDVEDGDREAERILAPVRVDNRAANAYDYFAVMRSRSADLGADYPFAIDGQGLRCTVDPDRATHRLYVFLLLAAQLRVLAERRRKYLTTTFERVMVPALTALMPGASVQLFGTTAEPGSRYKGSLRTKIKRLGEDLSETPGRAYAKIGEHDMGDAGLDVVAELPLGDKLPGRFVVFLQAACTDRWVEKQHSCSPSAWSQRLHLVNPQVTVCAIPHYFRDASGDWHDYNDLQDRLVLDRPRVLRLLSRNDGSCDPVALALVDDALAHLIRIGRAADTGRWGPVSALPA